MRVGVKKSEVSSTSVNRAYVILFASLNPSLLNASNAEASLKKLNLIAVHRYALTADPIETRLQSHTHP